MSENEQTPQPQQTNGDNIDEEERSQRIENFDNAMQNYVEILFGVRNCSNFAAHCFIKLYSKDKKKFMDTLKNHVESCNEKFREKIAEVIEEQNIATILDELDQSDVESFQNSFASKPVEEVRQQIYAMKREFIQNNKSKIEKEKEELSKQLQDETKKYNSQIEQVNQILQRKDNEISLYEKKLQEVNEQLEELPELGEI